MDDILHQSESEEAYQKRIQQLEQENLALLREFEGLQRENELLRNKYETTSSGDVITEPYDIVNAERVALKAKVDKYKNRIDELEKERLNTFSKLQEQLKSIANSGVLKDLSSVAPQRVAVVPGNTIGTIKQIKEQNKILTQKIEALEKERERQERKIRTLERKLNSEDEIGFRYNTVVMNHWMPFIKATKKSDKPKDTYSQAKAETFPATRYSSPLPEIRPQTNPLCSPSLLRETDYVTLYKRRLSMMSTKTTFSNLTYPSSSSSD